MPFSLNDVVLGGVLPAIVAAMLSLALRRWQTNDRLRNVATVVPFLAGFLAGYWSLSLGKIAPQSHWEWLPWVMLLTLSRCVPGFSGSDSARQRVILTTFIAAISSWLLVPTWDHLEPSRLTYGIILTAGVVLVVTVLEPLTRQFPPVIFLCLLGVVLNSAAMILAIAGSLRFSQMAICGVAAIIGMAIAGSVGTRQCIVVGIAMPFGLLISALMFAGQANSFSDVPLACYILPPLAPLTLWLAVRGPLSKFGGSARWLVLSAPLVVCLMAVATAYIETGAEF